MSFNSPRAFLTRRNPFHIIVDRSISTDNDPEEYATHPPPENAGQRLRACLGVVLPNVAGESVAERPHYGVSRAAALRPIPRNPSA
jgi:hypothetical protein